MRIVVNTPSGRIGRAAAHGLLDAGHDLTLVSRHPERCAELVARGARLVEGSIDDPRVLDRAFAGNRALLWVTPFAMDRPDYVDWALRLGRTAAEAARRHGIARVVFISSVGAQHDRGVGPVVCCKPTESAFALAVPEVCSLRCASFMENFLAYVPSIADAGVIPTPHPSDLRIPMVATQDIAASAVRVLQDPAWSHYRIVGVHGPEDVDHATAARLIGEALGRPVRHIEVLPEQARAAMIKQGIPAFAAELLADMYLGFREGRMVPAEQRSEQTQTPTTLDSFARSVLRPAVQKYMGSASSVPR